MSSRAIFGAVFAIILGFSCKAHAGPRKVVDTTEGAYVADRGRVNTVNAADKDERDRLAVALQSGALTHEKVDEFNKRLAQVQIDKTRDMMGHRGGLPKAEFQFLRDQQGKIDADIAAALKK